MGGCSRTWVGLSFQCYYLAIYWWAQYQPMLMAAAHGHLSGRAECFSEAKVIVAGTKESSRAGAWYPV